MQIGPTPNERLARARSDLRIGLPILIESDGAWWLAAAVETLPPERAAILAGGGEAVLAITGWRAETLHVPVYDGDLVRLRVPAAATVEWLRSVADPSADLASPLKGPYPTVRGGGAAPHRAALRLTKAAQLLPAVLLQPAVEAADGLTRVGADEVAPERDQIPTLRRVVGGRVPLRVSGAGRVQVFRPADGGIEHYAVEIGRPDRRGAPLVRLHSACFTGDVLGSLKCDCGPQLDAALTAMGEAGEGVLLYLNQEGRGIGLANKMRAYALQDEGFDTVEANHRLGFEDDERDFRIGTEILRQMGIGRIRLMTNNPAKVAMMRERGIEVVERVPLAVGQNPLNARYLATKARKSGHLL
ncbi:GTP cyclohydrolase II [Roseitranquillus sediminis]|uniref:GTP cyclohydrolase II n=1 Tax=Roseitranquillus sediminis TaxID=2809051 RepID=UPI001D0C3D2E|nr:GTP cyclohydrolase II [Roseitranquillus sediminis]